MGTVGGLLVLLMVATAGCDDPEDAPGSPSVLGTYHLQRRNPTTSNPYAVHIRRTLPCELYFSEFGSKYNEHFLEWTPDGTHLIFNNGTDIWLVDAEGVPPGL